MASLKIPIEYLCPITQEIMSDPVVTDYGHSYEKQEIEEHTRCKGADPQTRKPLSLSQIHPNLTLKNLIEGYLKGLTAEQLHWNEEIRNAVGDWIARRGEQSVTSDS